ncbi:hypothetical protein AVEN_170717-1 [Araneus ventricosus]|uniref:Uncharacterized protein n=1 Tax=Araneus ventricosus TaxID=182803 RepID=A0A4Y2T725_ARAVE|nr:hypothetical protein AVEN_170717-1 [Araneus ventricosus]
MYIATFYDSASPPHNVKSVSCFILPPLHKSEVVLYGIFPIVTPVVTNFSAAARTLDRFGISDRAGAAIVSATLQDVGIISESNVLNVVHRNKIRRLRTNS